jgi:large conductance mechanosensitive channel
VSVSTSKTSGSDVGARALSMISEFREFIARGNVVDLAVGVIIGAAFNDIVKTLVDQIVMPPIGLLLSGVDFANMQWVLKRDDLTTKADELVAIKYGLLFNATLKFLIVAWVVFMLVKLVNAVRRWEAAQPEPVPPPPPSPQEALLIEIRDLLKAQAGK